MTSLPRHLFFPKLETPVDPTPDCSPLRPCLAAPRPRLYSLDPPPPFPSLFSSDRAARPRESLVGVRRFRGHPSSIPAAEGHPAAPFWFLSLPLLLAHLTVIICGFWAQQESRVVRIRARRRTKPQQPYRAVSWNPPRKS